MREPNLTPQQYQRIILEQHLEIGRLTDLVAALRTEILELTEPKPAPASWPVPPGLERMQPWGEM